jgi:hypothetical protein
LGYFNHDNPRDRDIRFNKIENYTSDNQHDLWIFNRWIHEMNHFFNDPTSLEIKELDLLR